MSTVIPVSRSETSAAEGPLGRRHPELVNDQRPDDAAAQITPGVPVPPLYPAGLHPSRWDSSVAAFTTASPTTGRSSVWRIAGRVNTTEPRQSPSASKKGAATAVAPSIRSP
jgi:hypothetical protein